MTASAASSAETGAGSRGSGPKTSPFSVICEKPLNAHPQSLPFSICGFCENLVVLRGAATALLLAFLQGFSACFNMQAIRYERVAEMRRTAMPTMKSDIIQQAMPSLIRLF